MYTCFVGSSTWAATSHVHTHVQMRQMKLGKNSLDRALDFLVWNNRFEIAQPYLIASTCTVYHFFVTKESGAVEVVVQTQEYPRFHLPQFYMVVLSCLPFCHPAERHKPLPASRATWQHSWPKLSFNVHAARQLFPGFGAVGDCSVLSNIRCVYTTQTGSTLYGYHYHWPQLVKTKLHCYTLKHALLRIDQLPRQRQSISPSIVNGRLPEKTTKLINFDFFENVV